MTRSRRARVVLSVALVAGCAGVTALATVPSAYGRYSAGISNTKNTVTIGTASTATCATTVAADSPYIAYRMGDAGTVGATSIMNDSSGSGRTGFYRPNGVAYGVTGPCPRDTGAKAVTFSANSGYAYSAAAYPSSTTYTEEVWFKTSTPGGLLFGFGDHQIGASTLYDRQVFLNNAGNLVFGVYTSPAKSVVSPATYANGIWHQVVATQAPAGNANPGIRLYVDGSLVASDATVVTNTNYVGVVKLGYDVVTGFGTNNPTNPFYTGSMAWASYYNATALTPTRIAAHYAAGV